MAKKVGKDCKIQFTIGNTLHTLNYMGAWSITGISTDQIENTSFTDTWKQWSFGLKDGGQISFNGFLDDCSTTGQYGLMVANLQNSNITRIKLFVDKTSGYVPCQTTSYFSPKHTAGGSYDTQLSYVNITSYDITSDKSGMVSVSFTGKVSGCMVLE